MPLVSIGISVYQQPLHWLQQCIDSALSQSLTDLEVIVRADGANALEPNATRWLQRVAEADKRLRLLLGDENLGTFASLRRIFEQASGKYYVQLDADDFLHPAALELTAPALTADSSISMAYTHCLEVSRENQILRRGPRQAVRYSFNGMLVQFITFHMRCINSTHYAAAGGYRPALRYAGDYDLSLRLAEIGNVRFVPLSLYYYRRHQDNMSYCHRQQTVTESLDVARSALYRRGLADRYYLRLASSDQFSLVPLNTWIQSHSAVPTHSVHLLETHRRWL